MKKLMLSFAILSFCYVRAQVEILKPFIYGAEISVNGTSFDAKPTIGSVTPEAGYGAAVFGRFKILKLYAEIDLGYASHSTSTSYKTSTSSNKGIYTLDGFDLSGILGWRVVGIGKLGNFRVFAGYNYNSYLNITYKDDLSSVGREIKASNQCLLGGLGVDLWKFVFNFKYYYGLDNIAQTNGQQISTHMGVFSLGFKFN